MRLRFLCLLFGVVTSIASIAYAQAAPESTTVTQIPINPAPSPESAPEGFTSRHPGLLSDYRPDFSRGFQVLLDDQKQVWTSPARISLSDATWLVPLGGVAAGLFATDRQYSASLPSDPGTIHRYKNLSNAGMATLVGSGVGMYLLSFPMHNQHWRETGFLAGESALSSLLTVEALKYSFRRERPYELSGSGHFFQGGTSFPSEHAAAAWSIASVIAHEYPGTLPKLMAYTMASAVSLSAVRSRQHFPSDVLLGSAIGYLISQNIYRRRHDPEIGGGSWESPDDIVNEPAMHTPSFMGSPYVPLDSWIYPAIERLAALGYVRTQSLGMRPWTRSECVRLLTEAAGSEADKNNEVLDILDSLANEFASDRNVLNGERNTQAQLESVYQGTSVIGGRPLTDGFDFGQTVWNNYGRPFQEGLNSYNGASGWATAGPFVLYARGEYQYAPSGRAMPVGALNFISTEDYFPLNAPVLVPAATHGFQFLDAYVGMNLANWQVSFGRQSLWWGPSDSGTMAFTNNALPITMFRIDRVHPFRLPGPLRFLGDVRIDAFLGRLSGHEFLNTSLVTVNDIGTYGQNLADQPFLSGARISFKFTPNLELNLSKTTILGGPGNPVTARTLLKSALAMHVNGEPLGDGRSFIDFSYRIPGIRNRLTAYGEGFTEDEVSPISSPRKSVWQGGLYAPELPALHRLDLRLEGGSTSPSDFPTCNGCFYHNIQYVNGYTNNGNLMGSWIGRAAEGEMVQSNYWISGSKKIGFELRHRKIDRQFLPQGGTQNDAALTADLLTRTGFRVSGSLQYERWSIPVLAPETQSNITASFQLSYWPHSTLK